MLLELRCGCLYSLSLTEPYVGLWSEVVEVHGHIHLLYIPMTFGKIWPSGIG